MSTRTDILLAMCPPYGPEMPPLSLASLVESARANGFSACVLDLNIDVFRAAPDPGEWEMDHKEQWVWPTKFPDLWKRHAAALEAGIAKLIDADARVYGFSCHSDNRLTTQEVIRALRRARPDAIVIIGGMGVYSDTSRRSFQSGLVDAFVIGPEGEATLVEFARAVRDGRAFDDVPGLVLWRDGALRETAARDVADLAEFPFPTFSDFELPAYTTPNLPIVTSRGCKSHCLFCNDRVLMGKFRGRSAESVFDEIRHHVEVLGVRDFSFNDLQLNYNVTEIDRLCTLVNEHFGPASGAIRWNANIIVSDAFLPSILQNMRAAGCHTLTLGLESGSALMVKRMAKGFKLDTARRLMRDIKDAGITLWINLVVGFPGETDETVHESIAFVEEHVGVIDEVCVCNTCNLLEYSTLHDHRDRFGIAPAKDPQWDEVSWRTLDGANTFEQRMVWLGWMVEMLRAREVPIRQTNYHFEGEDRLHAARKVDVVLAIAPPADTRWPPYEIVSSSAFLRDRAGIEATCVDLNIEAYHAASDEHRAWWQPGVRETWADPERLGEIMPALGLNAETMADRLLAPGTGIVALYVHRANAMVTRVILEALKRKSPDVRVALFGPTTSIAAERDLFPDALCEFMVVGEVEASLADLVARLLHGADLATIRGVRFARPGGERHFMPREPIKPLADLPAPDYRELRPEMYGPMLGVRMSRGCVHRCVFCAEQPTEGPARRRAPARVFAEIENAFREHGVREFEFTDLILNNGDPKPIVELCDLLIAAKLPVTFGASFAPDERATRELFDKMKAAGFRRVRFGVENFADHVLRLMNKTYTAQIALKNLRDAHEAALETHVSVMIGFPGETYEDFYTNLAWMRKIEPWCDYVDTVTACEVLPHAKLERAPAKYQVLLPPKDHARSWSYMGYNNENYRETRLKEMAVWIGGLRFQFNYDWFVSPGSKFRRDEGRIRERIAKRIGRDIECVIVNMPPWGFTNPPVGPAVLATYLDSRGHPTKVLDYNARWYNEAPENQKLLWHVENKNFWSNDET